ncbi:MAG: hypothetical protein ACF787_12795, partial [Rhodopirellula sp. JB053]
MESNLKVTQQHRPNRSPSHRHSGDATASAFPHQYNTKVSKVRILWIPFIPRSSNAWEGSRHFHLLRQLRSRNSSG